MIESTELVIAATFMVAIGLAYSSLLYGANRLLQNRHDADELVTYIDNLLPQVQCAQCGYPGCRPYAEAIVAGAATDLCPPGGEAVALQLADLMGREPNVPLTSMSTTNTVRIVEADCIGCTRCMNVCPVDAIVGAELYLHTVLEKHCTGCELCIPECPVDCIELVTS